jgi:hypothetical protein
MRGGFERGNEKPIYLYMDCSYPPSGADECERKYYRTEENEMRIEMESVRNNADIIPNRNDIRNIADIPELYEIARISREKIINGRVPY